MEKYESIVIRNGEEKVEKRYFITSLTDVEKVAKGIRSHWETRKQSSLVFGCIIF